jgi:ssDNA-binding Zn-finger/Zn-ribbon topoisomerase 1
MTSRYTEEGLPPEELKRLRDTEPLIRRTDLECGDCGRLLVLKLGRYGRFYGCQKYPTCKGTVHADENGEPLGYPADRETRRSRHRLIVAKKFAMKRHTYDGRGARQLLNRPRGFSVGFLSKDECEVLVQDLCARTEGLDEHLAELPEMQYVFKSRWERLMEPYDIFDDVMMSAPIDSEEVEDIERGLQAIRRKNQAK